MTKQEIMQTLSLLQGYYHFLHMGKFFESLVQEPMNSFKTRDIKAQTGETSHFTLTGKTIERIIEQIRKHPDQRNIIGYMTEISAFKGIFGATIELIEESISFKNFCKSRLGEQYFAFEQIMRFMRNVLVHALSSSVTLKASDYENQREFLKKMNSPKVSFSFRYKDFFPEWKGSEKYGVEISIDFLSLTPTKSLFSLISLHQIYLMAELCYNMSEVFKMRSLAASKTEKENTTSHTKTPARQK